MEALRLKLLASLWWVVVTKLSYGRTCLIEDMSDRRTFLMGGYVLLKACLKGGHVLQDDVFLEDINITGWICLTGRHILQKKMYYWRMCLTGGHVLWEYMFYWMTCLIKLNVLL